jgi:hypothetical protein
VTDDVELVPGVPASLVVAVHLPRQLKAFWPPLRVSLEQHLAVRLVRTLMQTSSALLEWRTRAHGLLLRVLGTSLMSPAQ